MAEPRDNVSSHAPVDPALVLPPAVAAQAARANALMALQGQPHSALPQPPQAPAPPPPQFAPPPSDQLLNGEMLANPSTPTNPAQAQPFDLGLPGAVAPPPPPPAAPPPEPVAPEEWERRFASLNGRLNGARDTIQQLSDRNDQLERLLAGTAQSPAAGANGHGSPSGPGTGHGADAPPLTADFTPQEIEDWGPEMLDMIRRVAENRASRTIEQLRPVVQQTQQNARQQMIQYLDQSVPGWQDINVSQEFMDWAMLPDEFSGAIRRDLLRRWWDLNNGPRVAVFFRSFISGLPGGPARHPQPQPAPTPTPAPQAPAPSHRLSLQELATPSGTGSAAAVPPAPAAKRVYRRSEIAQFYQSRALGHFRGREQDAQAVENDIFAAGNEGRVING